MNNTTRCLSITLCLVIIGCGRSGDYPELSRVTGVVTLNGQPTEGIVVRFSPAEGRNSVGVTNEEGYYDLQYTASIKGAMLGEHRVTFLYHVPDPVGNTPEEGTGDTVQVLPDSLAKTGQQQLVGPNGNEIDFSLEAELY